MKGEYNWSHRATTNTAGKLPKDYEDQGKVVVQRCAYLVSAHNVLSELVGNTDQTGIYFVPTCCSRTWKTKSAKHIKVHGQNDKRQITVAVSSTTSEKCLHFQAIFQVTINRNLPKLEGRRLNCEHVEWN